jgi:hypothetical protein
MTVEVLGQAPGEICDRCGERTPVTWALRGPVKIELVCLKCKQAAKRKD